VTGLAGVPALVNLAHEMGLFKDVDEWLPAKERDRRYAPSALVNGTASELLHRELVYSGFLPEEASYSSRLLACIAVSGK